MTTGVSTLPLSFFPRFSVLPSKSISSPVSPPAACFSCLCLHSAIVLINHIAAETPPQGILQKTKNRHPRGQRCINLNFYMEKISKQRPSLTAQPRYKFTFLCYEYLLVGENTAAGYSSENKKNRHPHGQRCS